MDSEAAGKLSYSMKTEKYVKSKIVESSFKYPLVTGNSAAAKKINAVVEEEKAGWDKLNEEMAEMKIPEWLYDSYSTNDTVIKVTYRDSSMFCMRYMNVMYYAGGAHPGTLIRGMAFSSQNGKALTAAEVLGLTESQLKNKVAKKFEKVYDKDPEIFFAQDKAELKESVNGIDFNKTFFYVTAKKVVFVANQYELAPYAAGIITVSIKR